MLGGIEPMNEITLDTLLKRDPKQIFSVVDDEIVMLSIEEAMYYGLNKVASSIWELMAEPIEVKSIVEELRNIYNVPFEQCYAETIDCLNDMQSKNLVITC